MADTSGLQWAHPWPPAFVIERGDFLVSRAGTGLVLDLGCADWPLTAKRRGLLLVDRIAQTDATLIGGDYAIEGLRLVAKRGIRAVALDAHDLPFAAGAFDTVIIGELIEHVANPTLALAEARRVLTPAGAVIITTPSAYSLKHFVAAAITGKERVHPDHRHIFSPRTLSYTLDRAGLQATEWFTYVGSVSRSNWLARFFRLALRAVVQKRPFLAEGLIVVASAQDEPRLCGGIN